MPNRMRRSLALRAIFVASVCAALSAVAGGRSGIVIRDTALRADPYPSAQTIATLAPGTDVETGIRSGIWVRARSGDGAEGWAKLPDLRLAPERAADTASDETGQTRGNAFSRLARSVTSLLGGGRRQRVADRPATATIGIRGLTIADLEDAAPDPEAFAATDAFVATPGEARAFARAGGLTSRALPQTKAHSR